MMAAHEKTEPVYMIGVVAALTQMHAQTIRLYERLGLVTPQRRSKNRLYSEADVARLRRIRRLTQEMGINLAGVQVILDLLERLEQIQEERDAILAERDAVVQRSAEIEKRIREFLAQTGGKFP
jgi:MerR family transcriptional regulator/heat shock protein HspR